MMTTTMMMMMMMMMTHDDASFYSLGVINVTERTWASTIRVSNTVKIILSAVKSSNQNFILSYGESNHDEKYKIGILSKDGESFTRTFDLDLFASIQEKQWCPINLSVSDDGGIFVADCVGGRVFLFNSRLTDYQIITNNSRQLSTIATILHIKNRQQLFVWGALSENVPAPGSVVLVLSLSPCSLIKPKYYMDVATGIKRKRHVDITPKLSTGCKQLAKKKK